MLRPPSPFGYAVAALSATAILALLGACSNGDAPSDPKAFCRALDRLATLVADAEAGPAEATDVAAARALAADISRAAERLKDDPPEAIADDARDLAGVTVELAEELADFYQAILDDPSLANDPAFLASFEPVTDARRDEIDRAGSRVRPWVEDHCQPSETR